MNVLIVDGDEAVRMTLTEALSAEGFNVITADPASDTDRILSFRADAIFIDASVQGISDIIAASKDVFVIVSEEHPDIPGASGYIKKPLDINDIVQKIKELPNVKEKPKRSIFRSLFGKKNDIAETDPEPRFGRSYILVEDEPYHAYSMMAGLANGGCQILILTSGKIKAAKERIADARIVALSGKDEPDHVSPERIGTLMGLITEFVNRNERPAVMLDDLDLLIEKNSTNSVVTMIYQIVCGSERPMTLVISTRSGEMDDKDKELLKNNMEILIFR